MLYQTPPENFTPVIDVVCCWLTHDDEVLFVKRAEKCSQGGLESLPGGKVDPGESLEEALRRELQEECGIELDNLTFAKTFYIRRGEVDYNLHAFKSQVPLKPAIMLDLDGNSEYKWLTLAQLEELDRRGALIEDGMACIEALHSN